MKSATHSMGGDRAEPKNASQRRVTFGLVNPLRYRKEEKRLFQAERKTKKKRPGGRIHTVVGE